ncbi:hypothetical protein JW758_02520 [Candidatus Peregrinibacteria bacterium]|nr:hypothetical protein [Candidatus Peregrinibacteria bacterium]
MKLITRNIRGAIALTTTIILTAVMGTIVISMLFTGISSRLNIYNLIQSEKVFIISEGCVEEALIQLNRNNDYSGGTYNISEIECDIQISGSGDNRSLFIKGTNDEFTHEISIDVQLSSVFAIIDWVE